MLFHWELIDYILQAVVEKQLKHLLEDLVMHLVTVVQVFEKLLDERVRDV